MRALRLSLVGTVIFVLLGGVRSAAPARSELLDPSVRTDLLPGVTLSVEEAEPGIFRVTGDGVRDLASVEAADIVAGYDDGIWLLREDGFLRLGSEGAHAWPDRSSSVDGRIFEVAPDGTMWVIPDVNNFPMLRRGAGLRSTDGEEWTVQPCPGYCEGLTVVPDGTVWASWDEGGRLRVGHLGATGWSVLDGDLSADLGFGRFFSTDAGDLYGSGVCDWVCGLSRYEDGVWREERTADHLVVVGPEGTVWEDGGGGPAMPHDQVGLARSADGEWELWSAADFLPDIRFGLPVFDYDFEVAPDGSLWFSLWRGAEDSDPLDLDSAECDGLARFDGQTLDRFLEGRCMLMDIAADGTVWVLAADAAADVLKPVFFPDDQAWDLYVITLAAVTAST